MNLYCGVGIFEAVQTEKIAATVAGAGLFDVPDWMLPIVGQDTFYLARRVSGSGREEQGTMAVVRVRKGT